MSDGENHDEAIEMSALYFIIRKEGTTSYLKRTIISAVLGLNMGILRAYNRHSREKDKVSQITCDRDVEATFLQVMSREELQRISSRYNLLLLTIDHPARRR